jgi:RNA polymerase sigma factor for flagellar operon FliA
MTRARRVPEQNTTESQAVETTSARDQIVLEHLSLVKAIAIRVHESVPVHVDLDDLIHAGVMGLIGAAEKYDAGKKVAFQSYAKHRIKGAMLDSLRQLDWASRDLRRRHKQLESVTRDLAAAMERPPTELEIAEKMGVGVDRWRQMAIELRMVGLLSSSSRAPDQENQAVPEFPAPADTQPDSICVRRQMSSLLDTAMQTLPVRYQKVVSLYYSNDMTMKEIGGVLGINESRVSQIHKTALEKMAVALQSAGIHSCEALV